MGIEQEKEVVVSLSPEDVEANNKAKADFVDVLSGYIQDLKRFSISKAEELLDNLKPLIDLTDASDYKPALVRFDKKHNIKDPDTQNNSKLS